MKFIKSLFLKIKAKSTLKTYQTPLLVTLFVLLIVNLIILIAGAIIGFCIDNVYYEQRFFNGNFSEALVTSVKWMISANTITSYDAHDDLMMLALAAVIVVIEMVLFSGAIVAMLTTALRSYIDIKSKAKGKIIVSNHFVILNWNSKVPEMIYNLMLKGFKNNIVILSNQSKEYIENEIKSLFLVNDCRQKGKVNLIIKEGNPLLRSNIEDISIDKASNIVVMAREDMSDGDDDNILNSDLYSLKIMLMLGSFSIRDNCQIVVETDSDDTRSQIEGLTETVATLKNKRIIPVSFNRKIGQIIAQTIIHPEMASVYLELFSFEGKEFYSTEYKGTVEEYLKTHNQAIPVVKYDKLFVLCEDEKQFHMKREKAYESNRILPLSQLEIKEHCTIFVIGDNKKSEFILENLNRSAALSNSQYIVKHYAKNDNDCLIADIRVTDGKKKVLILSDDTVGADSYDANVFVTLIELSRAFPEQKDLTFITEVLDSRNLSSVRDFGIQNTIISNKMMSLLITQLVMNQDSKTFFDKLLTVDANETDDDFDIAVTRAEEIFDISSPLVFSSKAELVSSFYKSLNKQNMLLGIYQGNELLFLADSMDKKEKIEVAAKDSFVYISF